jgi:4-hydroxybutyryl-CoA dehydratase/vinylacetyl-CoA-Delta-isomerase
MALIHTCYRILDIERSVAFYEALGFREQSRFPIGEEAVNVYLQIPGDGEEPRLELTWNRDRERPYEIGDGYGHVAVRVADLDAVLAALAGEGIEPEREPYSVGDDLSRLCFVRDPDGYRVELIERSPSPTEGARARSPEQYRESLRDGRRVYYRGERVEDVTTHPVMRHAVRHGELDFEMAESERFGELSLVAGGHSRYFEIPRDGEDLLLRSALIEAGTRAGRTMAILVKEVGTDALLALMAMRPQLGAPYAERIERFYQHARDNDLALCVAQTDAKGDRALRPSEQPNPEAYLRIVERRRDGIVVRGAKLHTSVSVNGNEMIVLPTREMGPADADCAVSFAIPVDTPGLRLVASPYMAAEGKAEAEHPLSAGRKIVETTTLFEDVFVPAERVFMAGEHRHAGELARSFVEFHRFTAISYKLPLVDGLVGGALLAARVNGLERAGHVRDKLSSLISYAETLRALTRQAAVGCSVVDGIAVPDALVVNIAKLHFAQGLHTAMQHLQDLAGGLLVTYPSPEDLEHEEHGPFLRRCLEAAGGASGSERMQILNMISDLAVGEYGGYQAVLAIHAEGSIEAEKLTILAQYDQEGARGYARWLAGLDPSRWPPA